METIANSIVLILLTFGMYCLLDWLWEVGVTEILVYTQGFFQAEAKRIRVQPLPELYSRRLWDRMELLLYYSGIRMQIPFFSAKVCLLFLIALGLLAFLVGMLCLGSVWKSIAICFGMLILFFLCLEVMRRSNRKRTERYLLELLNLTESFTATGEEALAILGMCSLYVKGPIGQALNSIEKYLEKGWSAGMVLAKLKVMLEHPKWQEFIHNLHVCSMYNSDFSYVFRSSRKSIQSYLSSKKERQSVKTTARMEMFAIATLCLIIIVVLSRFLQIAVEELLWENTVGKGCTLYMLGILILFFGKMGDNERE